jgi:redox-sensitive bicupin YhaK (pirin superfamily)
MRIIPISQQATGAFNNGQIIENKPIGFPQDGGFVRPYSSLFYWARAEGMVDSTIPLHPHQGFEIMSFVLEGRIRHFDTKMNDWKPLEAGDVQIIRAGNGISHAEHVERGGKIFQIWIDPDLSKTLKQEASYDDYKGKEFQHTVLNGTDITHFAGEKGTMRLDTPGIDIRKIHIQSGEFKWEGQKDMIRSLYILSGSGMLNDKTIEQDDYVIIDDGADIHVDAHPGGLEIFALSVPVVTGYPTYAHRLMH